MLNAEAGYEKWKFALPETGGTLWGDTFVVPMGSPRKANAETLMNYYYEPEVAAQVAAWVNYVSPVNGAKEVLAKEDPELAESPLIFPSADWLKDNNVQGFRALTPQEDADYSAIWERVRGN